MKRNTNFEGIARETSPSIQSFAPQTPLLNLSIEPLMALTGRQPKVAAALKGRTVRRHIGPSAIRNGKAAWFGEKAE